MNKKILMVSIIAVCILIGVSFSGVVGYQTTKSSFIDIASPLFNMRIKRAIGEESMDIAYDYVGKGEENDIPLTGRMKRVELAQKVINIISKMDDKTFSKFVVQVILTLKNQKQITDTETSDMLQTLRHIRRNPDDLKHYNTKNIPIPTLQYITCHGFPGCIINSIMEIIMWILISIAGWITSHTCVCNTLFCTYDC